MGEKDIGLKLNNIESGSNGFRNKLINPLMRATGNYLLHRLPEKNAHLDEVEHEFLGFYGANTVVDAIRDIPGLSDPGAGIICDMDGPLIKVRPSIKFMGVKHLPDARFFDVDVKQVEALENSPTSNIYATNRGLWFPETKRLIGELQEMGVENNRIFPYQDKEFGVFRDQDEFNRLVEMVKEKKPNKLFLIFDMYNWPITLMQDITGSSGNYLKDILHNLSLEQQESMAVGMVGLTPLIKDTFHIPFNRF